MMYTNLLALSPKDYCLIPGNGAIKLVERPYDVYKFIGVITKGLLFNPQQRRHKTCCDLTKNNNNKSITLSPKDY